MYSDVRYGLTETYECMRIYFNCLDLYIFIISMQLLWTYACASVGPGYREGIAVGPLISAAAKERVCSIISDSVSYGSSLILEGRNEEVLDHPKGFFLGPSIIEAKDTNDPAYQASAT